MDRDELTGIRVLDGHVTYRDGSEGRMLDILSAAADCSSDSDELARQITDWPSRYHLSRQRANLIRPLLLGPDLRILEVGAGTGVLSRALGESGASVTALEGHLDRARAAAARCRDLDNIEVVCGPLENFEDALGFDLVCLVGVLEYAASDAGHATDHQQFLGRAADLVRPGGALMLAIENAIGVKYLLGYDEDHLGMPWIGVEGYPGSPGVRTFSRRTLSDMLDTADLNNRAWFFPFPDYKLPTTILAESVYTDSGAPDLVDQLVRQPVGDGPESRALLCDDRRAHRTLVEAGLGPEVANSFLVLAWKGDERPPVVPDEAILAWRAGDDRRRRWRRAFDVRRTDRGLIIGPLPGRNRDSTEEASGWLLQDPEKTTGSYVRGLTIEQLALDACHRGDRASLKDALCSWRWFLDQQLVQGTEAEPAPHPFLSSADGPRLPPEYLDVALSNFVVGDDGLHFIDREWRARDGVAAQLVMARALWLFAKEIIQTGVDHPWPDDTTVDRLAAHLGDLCELDVDHRVLHRLRESEVELQHLVTGRESAVLAKDLEWLGSCSRVSPEVVTRLPFSHLRTQIERLHGQVVDLEHRLAELEESSAARQHDLNHQLGESREAERRARGDLRVAQEHLTGTQHELDAHVQELASARQELEMWRQWRAAFEAKGPVRLFRWVQHKLGRAGQ